MRERKGRKGRKRLAELSIVGMLLLTVYFALFGGEYTPFGLRRLERLEAERAAELRRTEAEIDSLAALAAELRSDPAAIERAARERYGMIREGEILYRFREPETGEQDTTDAPEPPE